MMDSPCSAREIKNALGRSDIRVLACCVLHNVERDEYEAYAVVSADGGREIQVGDSPVFLLRPSAPLSAHLQDCRLGDTFQCYQVVSVDGSPILSEAGRQRLCRERHEDGAALAAHR